MSQIISTFTVEWKNNPDRKPLVLERARQVGKTYILKEFGTNEYRNLVLQQLENIDTLSVYYASKENSTQEIDFLVQTCNEIIPVKVKAEENVKSKSLHGFVAIDHAEKHLKGLRCSMKNFVDQGWMQNIPLYSVEQFFRKII